jgi:hypothetical protein
VHYVGIDFVPGVYHNEAFDKAPPRSMFGGLAVAVRRPERCTDELVIHQSQKRLFEPVLRSSSHVVNERPLFARAPYKTKRLAAKVAGERSGRLTRVFCAGRTR